MFEGIIICMDNPFIQFSEISYFTVQNYRDWIIAKRL